MLHPRRVETWVKRNFQVCAQNRRHKSLLHLALAINCIRLRRDRLVVVLTVLTRRCLTTGRGASNSREMGGRSASANACRLGKEPMLVTSQLLKSPVGDQLLTLYSSASTCNITRPVLIWKWNNLKFSGSRSDRYLSMFWRNLEIKHWNIVNYLPDCTMSHPKKKSLN
jgi:hypothetical protein